MERLLGFLGFIAFLFFGTLFFLGSIFEKQEEQMFKAMLKDNQKAMCMHEKLMDYMGGTFGAGFIMLQTLIGLDPEKAKVKNSPYEQWIKECNIHQDDFNDKDNFIYKLYYRKSDF